MEISIYDELKGIAVRKLENDLIRYEIRSYNGRKLSNEELLGELDMAEALAMIPSGKHDYYFNRINAEKPTPSVENLDMYINRNYEMIDQCKAKMETDPEDNNLMEMAERISRFELVIEEAQDIREHLQESK